MGIILAVDATRLSRNGREWQTLIEFCGVVGCLIADEQSVYDPTIPTDRAMLGIQGAVSELELSNIRRRLLAARRLKAKRGELIHSVPAGYQRVRRDGIEKDPDLRVQRAIELVFRKFSELQSMRQVYHWLLEEDLELPRLLSGHHKPDWKAPTYARGSQYSCESDLFGRLRLWSHPKSGHHSRRPDACQADSCCRAGELARADQGAS